MRSLTNLSFCDVILIIILVILSCILLASIIQMKNEKFLTDGDLSNQLDKIAESLSKINVDKIKYNIYNL